MILPYVIAAATLIAFDNIRVRYTLRKLKEEQAARVAAALSGMVEVDGVSLPSPDDERFVLTERIDDVKKAIQLLSIGAVHVSQQDIFVGQVNGGHIPAMGVTDITENYCSAVWKAYRSRVARKAIEQQ